MDIINDFVQAFTLNTPRPLQCIVCWGFQVIFLKQNTDYTLLHKIPQCLCIFSKIYLKICIYTRYCCSFSNVYSASIPTLLGKFQNTIQTKIQVTIFFCRIYIFYFPRFEQNDLLCFCRNLCIILLEHLS